MTQIHIHFQQRSYLDNFFLTVPFFDTDCMLPILLVFYNNVQRTTNRLLPV